MATQAQKQLMLSMAYIADSQSSLTGKTQDVNKTAEAIIKCALSSTEIPTNNDWTLEWGSVVYRFPFTKYSDNTMFVAKSKSEPNTYTIGVAGTTPKSISDWLLEDFWVATQIEWGYGSAPQDAKISKATHIGLHVLQQMIPQAGMPGEGQHLNTYLEQIVKEANGEAVTLYVSGHSLGGALAPTLALWLNDTQSTWDPNKQATISVFAYAGATPGNEAFANHLNSQFTGSQLNIISNTLDVVPHAWDYKDMEKIPHLYGKEYPLGLVESALVYGVAVKLKSLGYTPLGVGDQVQPLEGTVHKETDPSGNKLKDFAAQMLYQHVVAYPTILGIPNLDPVISACVKKQTEATKADATPELA